MSWWQWLGVPSVRSMAKNRDERYADRLPTFALRLAELRNKAGLTQDVLAERSGLSVRMIQRLERPSDGGNPRLTTLLALADALSCRISDLTKRL